MDTQPPTVWLVINKGGIFGAYTDEAEAREKAKATASLLTHVPVDADYRHQ